MFSPVVKVVQLKVVQDVRFRGQSVSLHNGLLQYLEINLGNASCRPLETV